MNQQIRNPDPAWPEIVAFAVFLILCMADGLSNLKMIPFLEENWWPMLRLTLWIWAIARVIDLLTGGIARRMAMRAAYRQMVAHIRRST